MLAKIEPLKALVLANLSEIGAVKNALATPTDIFATRSSASSAA